MEKDVENGSQLAVSYGDRFKGRVSGFVLMKSYRGCWDVLMGIGGIGGIDWHRGGGKWSIILFHECVSKIVRGVR